MIPPPYTHTHLQISFFVPSPALQFVEKASAAGAESTNDIRAMNTKRRVTTVFMNFNFNTMVPTNGDEAKVRQN